MNVCFKKAGFIYLSYPVKRLLRIQLILHPFDVKLHVHIKRLFIHILYKRARV
jgi:hypothetical protein